MWCQDACIFFLSSNSLLQSVHTNLTQCNPSVCIRHRGSFMKSFSILTMVYVAVMAAILAAFVNAVVNESFWDSLEDIVGEGMFLGQAGGSFWLLPLD